MLNTEIEKLKACKNCPFRAGSIYGYDDDGLENLDRGYHPSCHEIVGANRQFSVPYPDKRQICKGFLLFEKGVKGFNRPYVDNL